MWVLYVQEERILFELKEAIESHILNYTLLPKIFTLD